MAGENILVVDDEPMVSEVIKKELGREAYHVDCAMSGKEALEAVRKKTYDVVLIDNVMAPMDGVATCRAIREVSPEPILIYMTGIFDRANVLSELQFVEAGGRLYYLYKPFSNGDLSRVINQALSEKR